MAGRSRISIAKPDICKTFDDDSRRVFTRTEIDVILRQNRQFWRLAQSTTTNSFIEYLKKNASMKLQRFEFPKRPTNRYVWGSASEMEVIQSLQPDGYFSHFTALFLHGLTDQIPKTVYLNVEQWARSGGGQLTQAGINRAFGGRCRVSNNIAPYGDRAVCQLNGGNTDCLGVVETELSDGVKVRVTNIERTLLDIVVRPVYSGGVYEVAKAYKAATDHVSINRLTAYLKSIGYVYPYHQSIGFYMDRAGGYSETQLSMALDMGLEFDFHLDYKLAEKDFNENWRVFTPKGF